MYLIQTALIWNDKLKGSRKIVCIINLLCRQAAYQNHGRNRNMETSIDEFNAIEQAKQSQEKWFC